MMPQFETEDEATNWCIDWLRKRGFNISHTGFQAEVVSPAELGRRFSLKATALFQRLHHEGCPAFDAKYGISGRLTWITTNPALLAWLKRPLQQGKALARK